MAGSFNRSLYYAKDERSFSQRMSLQWIWFIQSYSAMYNAQLFVNGYRRIDVTDPNLGDTILDFVSVGG